MRDEVKIRDLHYLLGVTYITFGAGESVFQTPVSFFSLNQGANPKPRLAHWHIQAPYNLILHICTAWYLMLTIQMGRI